MANWQNRCDAIESELLRESGMKASVERQLARIGDEVTMLKFDLGDCHSCESLHSAQLTANSLEIKTLKSENLKLTLDAKCRQLSRAQTQPQLNRLNSDLQQQICAVETLTVCLESTKTQFDELQNSMEAVQETLSLTRIERDSLGEELIAKNVECEYLTDSLRKIANQTVKSRFLLENKDQELENSMQLVQDLEKKISALQIKPMSSTKKFVLNIPPTKPVSSTKNLVMNIPQNISDWSASDAYGPSPDTDKSQPEILKKVISSGGRDLSIPDSDALKLKNHKELEI